MKANMAAVALGVSVSLSVAAATSSGTYTVSTFDDVHYWVGTGTNKCVLVVDWAAYGQAKAWGYRWNGVCTNLAEVVTRIEYEDPRLKTAVSGMGTSWVDFYFFGYDVNDSHPAWDLANGAASDPDAYVLREASDWSSYWVLFGPLEGTVYPTYDQSSSWYAANAIIPENGQWFCFRYDGWVDGTYTLTTPTAAESPYGYEVVEAYPSNDQKYNNETTVLGPPARYMSGTWGGPVNPANPAWYETDIFTASSDGITIKFDHPVVDDPANPFGIDFIVFGNAFCVGNGSYISASTDPASYPLTGKGSAEDSMVEVSADGETWYTCSSWKSADAFAPTLGYQYDVESPDTTLFSGNSWWGKPARATYPVNPAIDFSDCKGLSLAQLCQRYDGSAGGAGYDLSGVTGLPTDSKGRKWFQYLRFSAVESETPNDDGDYYSMPEIDAVADVAPVSGYELWRLANYAWATAWDESVAGASATAANGLKNVVNYALGLSSTASAAGLDFTIAGFTPGDTTHSIQLKSNKQMTEVPYGLVVKKATALDGAWTSEMPILSYSEQQSDGTWLNTFTVSADGGSFLKLSIEE